MNTRSFSSPTLRTSSTGSQARADRIWHVCCLVVVAACTIAYVGATRRAVETFPLPVALAALQLCVGLAWSLALSLFGVRKPFPKLGSAEVRLVMPATLLHAAAAAATAAALRYTPPLSFLALLGAEAGSHSVAAALLPSTAGAAAAVACAAIAALAAHFGCGVPAAPALLGAAAYALSASRHAAAGALYAGPSVTLRRLSGSSCHSLVAAAAALVLVPFACVWDWYSMVLWLGNGEGAKAGELAALLVAGGVAKAAMDEAMFIAQKQLGRQAHTRLETGRAALASLVIAATMPDVHMGVYAWGAACAVALASALLPLRARGAVTDFSPSHASRHRQLPQSPRSPAKTE